MSRRLAASLLGLALSGCASRPVICTVPKQLLAEDRSGQPELWYRLLVDRGLDGAPCDCTGKPIVWQAPTSSCREADPPSAPLAPARFSASDLIFSAVGDDAKLVWVVTQRFENGDALGPVALVRERSRGPEVLVTGTLRAGLERTRLSLVTLGEQSFLAADGESCTGRGPNACRRSTVLLAEQGGRFVATPFVDENGACMGPAALDQARSEVVPLSSSTKRRFDLSSTLAFDGDHIIVQETVTVSDFDPSKSAPPRLERRADAQRIVRATGGRLVVHDPSLWSRVVDQTGGR